MSSRFVHLKARMLSAVIFLVAGTVLSFGFSVPVQAVEQGGLGGRPAHPRKDNPRSQSIFVHKLQPGEQVSDAVEVINGTTETKRVLVYAVDSQVSSGGAFACAQAADKPLAVGTWVSLDKQEVTLAPAGKQVVSFTVKVPKGASPGEHNGCIVLQDTKQQRAPDSNGIVLSMRSAIRLAVTVPGDIRKGLDFTGLGAQPKDDKKLLLSTTLRNSGNVSLDAQLDIKLTYIFGASATTANGSFPVLSGSEARFNFEGSRPFWGGWYRLQAAALYNNNLDSSVGEGNPNARTKRSAWVFIAPQPAAAAAEGGLLVALTVTVIWLVRRRLSHRDVLRGRAKHTVAAGEDLHTVARRYNMSWKLLVRVNKLKPPYQLKTGQVLIVASNQPKNARPGKLSQTGK